MVTSTFVDLPAHRVLPTASMVAHRAGGRAMRDTPETPRPAWLTRTAVAAAMAVAAVMLAGCGPAATTASTATTPTPTAGSSAAGSGAASSSARPPHSRPTTPTAAPPATGGALPVEDPDHASAQPFPTAGTCHARDVPGGTLPDPVCTPGATDPHVTQTTLDTTICRTGGYTSTVRPPVSVTSTEKRSALRAYNDTAPINTYELDHLVSLELGGSPNSPHNLWPQPGSSPNPKDKLETALHGLVCSHRMTLADAQTAIATDWVTTYRQVLGGEPHIP